MLQVMTMIQLGVTKQIRRYSFLVVASTIVFLGVFCVPSVSSGYEIFNLGGVRGIYNSAWLGTLGAMLCCILLWLPGFYLLRSQVSEDAHLKIEQIIAASSISRTAYLFYKAVISLLVLMFLQIIFLSSFAIMQLIRGEDININLVQYLLPFVFISLPVLIVVAALTVLFDVIPFLRGAFGNILIFMIWVTSSSLSVAMPKNPLDLFGIGLLMEQILLSAKKYYPEIGANSSFGYYPIENTSPSFSFEGIQYDHTFLFARLFWIGISILLIGFASILFGHIKSKHSLLTIQGARKKKTTSILPFSKNNKVIVLPPIERSHSSALLQMILLEIKILLPRSIWWYIAAALGCLLCLFLPVSLLLKWAGLILVLPISTWSKMGCNEKINRTYALVASSCSSVLKWWSTFIAGNAIAFTLSVPILFRFMALSQYTNVLFWLVGILFISSIAIILGKISGTPRLFESIYIIIFYFGVINDLKAFDFLGRTNNNIQYLLFSIIIIGFSLGYESLRGEKLR